MTLPAAHSFSGPPVAAINVEFVAAWLPPIMLGVVVWLYFMNNPLRHGVWFMVRRFINWFPLGMTYAFLYMGRYNLQVAKNSLGDLMTKDQFGIIFAAGTATYAFSFLVNGPLVDKSVASSASSSRPSDRRSPTSAWV